MSRLRLSAVVCLLACLWHGGTIARGAGCCRVTMHTIETLQGRVDSLLAPSPDGVVVALVGQPRSPIRFLPHDHLVLLGGGKARSITLPPYITAPGLAGAGGGAYVLDDMTLLAIDGGSRAVTRHALAAQAIGWPAAITAAAHGAVYLIGQPADAMEAQAYAFEVTPRSGLRLRWRAPLGLTHAGIWIGLAPSGQVAVYMPDQHDAAGTILLLDGEHGTTLRTYAVPMPPGADDLAINRLFLAGIGAIQARDLQSGALVAQTAGAAPLAAGNALGLVAFVRGKDVVVARGATLQPVAVVAAPGGGQPSALAWQGSGLLVGTDQGVVASLSLS